MYILDKLELNFKHKNAYHSTIKMSMYNCSVYQNTQLPDYQMYLKHFQNNLLDKSAAKDISTLAYVLTILSK